MKLRNNKKQYLCDFGGIWEGHKDAWNQENQWVKMDLCQYSFNCCCNLRLQVLPSEWHKPNHLSQPWKYFSFFKLQGDFYLHLLSCSIHSQDNTKCFLPHRYGRHLHCLLNINSIFFLRQNSKFARQVILFHLAAYFSGQVMAIPFLLWVLA